MGVRDETYEEGTESGKEDDKESGARGELSCVESLQSVV